jgi:hypothetical protein
MPTPLQKQAAAARSATGKATTFNYNKLQAAACMAASAVVSIALITWVIKSFL